MRATALPTSIREMRTNPKTLGIGWGDELEKKKQQKE